MPVCPDNSGILSARFRNLVRELQELCPDNSRTLSGCPKNHHRTCETENENKTLYCLLCGEKKGTYRKHTSDNSYSEVFHGLKKYETAELRDENTAVFHIS
jgi:hypothetical protein